MLKGLALLTLGLDIGFFNQNERKVEDILNIMFSVLTTSSQVKLKTNKEKKIQLSGMQWFKCTFQTLCVENSMPKMAVLGMGPS